MLAPSFLWLGGGSLSILAALGVEGVLPGRAVGRQKAKMKTKKLARISFIDFAFLLGLSLFDLHSASGSTGFAAPFPVPLGWLRVPVGRAGGRRKIKRNKFTRIFNFRFIVAFLCLVVHLPPARGGSPGGPRIQPFRFGDV